MPEDTIHDIHGTPVSLRRCADYEPRAVRETVRRLLEPLGGIGAFVAEGDRVLLKPNLIVPRPAEAAVTTHPEIVRAVALEVIDAGGKPVVGDSPAFSSALAVARRCGVADVAEEIGMPVVDLGQRPRVRAVCDGVPIKRVTYGADALEADVVVNLPKVKAHCQVGVTAGVKNLFGMVSGKRKALHHFRTGRDDTRFGKLLVAVARHFSPALTIADGIVGLERDGPTDGDPRALGFLAASPDVVAVDRVVLEILGYDPEEICYMRAARLMRWGAWSLDDIDVLGEPLDALRVGDFVRVPELSPIHFTLPRVIKSVAKQAIHLARARMEG